MSLLLSGKIAIVTGASSGIGRVTARTLALQGAHVFLACRSRDKTQPVLDEIGMLGHGQTRAEFLPLDLGDFRSVRQCAEGFLQRDLPLDILVANAGLAGQRGMTASGFELAFGTCHMGHFLLTQRLLNRLKESAPSRIVVVSSKAHRFSKTIDLEAVQRPTSSLGGLREYSMAKLANLLFAVELARRLEGTGVNSYAVHPGIVASDVWRKVPGPVRNWIRKLMISEEEGAKTSLYCATSLAVASENGLYYEKSRPCKPAKAAVNADLASRLWAASETWITS